MALLTVQSVIETGTEPTYESMELSDTFTNNGRTFIHVKNDAGVSRTISVDSLVNCNQGFDHNLSVAIAAGEERMIGVFPQSRFSDSNGLVTVSVDVITDVSIAAISI